MGTIAATKSWTILVVTEDPVFLDDVWQGLTKAGHTVRGCLGPAHAPCELEEHGFCRLACDADVVLVDALDHGAFYTRGRVVGAAGYAARLALAYPRARVFLVAPPLVACATRGDVTAFSDRAEALRAVAATA